jgi:hypothetical protein
VYHSAGFCYYSASWGVRKFFGLHAPVAETPGVCMRTLVIAHRHLWREQPPVVLSRDTLRYLRNVPLQSAAYPIHACDSSGRGFRARRVSIAAATTVGRPVTGLVLGAASAYRTPAVPIHHVGKGPVNGMAQAAEAAL